MLYSSTVVLDHLRSLARETWTAAAVLVKPFSPAEVVETVRGAVTPRLDGGRGR